VVEVKGTEGTKGRNTLNNLRKIILRKRGKFPKGDLGFLGVEGGTEGKKNSFDVRGGRVILEGKELSEKERRTGIEENF